MAIKTFTTGEVLTASDTNTYLANSGLVYVKSQTVGTGVSSVQVTSAFSTDYDNYKIIYTGGVASASADLRLSLGASAASYYGGLIYNRPNTAAPAGIANNNTAYWQYGAGLTATTNVVVSFEMYQPFLALRTGVFTQVIHFEAPGGALGTFVGFHDVAASYTSFTFTPSAGTLTGGTITVYGYRKA
jgi:hypothetical protein